ncbi:MAG: hypothetical protein ACK5QC_15980 [Bacteroidota bacterium]|jgi:hypothetical protein
MKLENITNAKDLITSWLIRYPELRDNDAKLIANIWAKSIGQERFDNMSARDLLQMFVNGDLLQVETIRRTRQKIQEHNPFLRGASYRQRQERATEVTKGIKKI